MLEIRLELSVQLSKPTILFISFLDFKERSIQVIRKTPEAFRDSGWDVDYVVLRDITLVDNYRYEKIVNIEDINVYRSILPFHRLINRFIDRRILRRIIQKTSYIFGFFKVLKILVNNKLLSKKYDIVYGYEVNGINALKLLRSLGFFKLSKTVFRYQGSFMYDYLQNKRWSKILSNIDHLVALKSRPDLAIMTNDGTQGDELWKMLNPAVSNFKFWRNGVDIPLIEENPLKNVYDEYDYILVTVSRLNHWKRVDRSISLMKALCKDDDKSFKLIVVGDGPESVSLKNMVKALHLENVVDFIGSVPAREVQFYMDISDVFLSFYDGSNLGNPIMEAMRLNKLIVTLNNGTTGDLILHGFNGLLYDLDDFSFTDVANDIIAVLRDKNKLQEYKENLRCTEREKLWTWNDRFKAEIEEVFALIRDED